MSRNLLIPQANGTFLLHPVDGEKERQVKLPKGLVDGSIFGKVNDSEACKKLLISVLKTDISRDKNGFVNDIINTYEIKYDDALINICNKNFLETHEKLYALLRNFGVTF